jgi:hypothetical protein
LYNKTLHLTATARLRRPFSAGEFSVKFTKFFPYRSGLNRDILAFMFDAYV